MKGTCEQCKMVVRLRARTEIKTFRAHLNRFHRLPDGTPDFRGADMRVEKKAGICGWLEPRILEASNAR